MEQRSKYHVEIGRGAVVNSGRSIGGGVTVGTVNGGVGVSTPVGSVSLIGSGASVASRTSIGNGSLPSTPIASGTIRAGNSTVTMTTRTTVMESNVSNGVGTAVDYANIAVSGAQIFAEATQKEKEEMQRLNERLSGYIARVKELEEQHKMLVASLANLRGKWGTKNDSYKSSYSVTVSDVRDKRTEATRGRVTNDIRVARLKTDIAELRAKTDDVYRLTDLEKKRIPQWMAAIEEADDELAKLSKRFEGLKSEEAAGLAEQARLNKELADLHERLDATMIDKLTFQSQVQAITDEIKFLKTVHAEEVRELQSLLVVAPADTKEFFRNELALAVRDIRKEYDLLAKAGKAKLENWYKSKVISIQQISERKSDDAAMYRGQVDSLNKATIDLKAKYSKIEQENLELEAAVRRLQAELEEDHTNFESAVIERDQILIRMREECALLVSELQALLDSKALLDGEIAIYRAMIEGEGRRVGVVQTVAVQESQESHGHWEEATRTKFDTVAHGHVAVKKCDTTGQFVTVANTSQHVEERIGGWKIKRTIDNNRVLNYFFPVGTTLKPGEAITVYAKGHKAAGPNDLIFENETSWGYGISVVTALYNSAGEEKAVYTQTTVKVSSA